MTMDLREAKIRLRSYCVENQYEKPTYEWISKTKEGVRKIYTVKVSIDGVIASEGEGASRRIAEYKAAMNALNELNVKSEQNKDQKFNDKENKHVADQNGLEKNHENNSQSKDESNDQQLVNGKEEEVSEEVKENGIKIDDKNDSNNESYNIESEAFLRTVRNSISVNNEENKNENLVENSINSTNDKNSYNDENIEETMDSMNSTNEAIDKIKPITKNVSFSEETKDVENIKSNNDKNNQKTPKFRPIEKNAASVLLDFCMKKRLPLPFYDSRYTEGSFWLKCSIELESDDGKQEFQGLGCGDTLKAAKIVAAEDVIQQLKEKNLI
jgi:dsRNA-specific ribonuclease